ncbi:MAG: hypothetical protein IID05_11270 [Gemmatimonadetes bacterium]|nr:hypothetical protein [Gemmatimonadota bacterium]
MTLVFAGVVLLYPRNTNVGIAVVAVGIFSLLMGVWYAAHPYLKSERRYVRLRAEVDGFIGLVRQLNAAACAGQPERVQGLTAEMHESVERMRDLAGKEDAPGSHDERENLIQRRKNAGRR